MKKFLAGMVVAAVLFVAVALATDCCDHECCECDCCCHCHCDCEDCGCDDECCDACCDCDDCHDGEDCCAACCDCKCHDKECDCEHYADDYDFECHGGACGC